MFYHDISGLAELAGRSKQYIRWLVERGKLPYKHTKNWKKGKVIFDKNDTEKALEIIRQGASEL